MKHYFISALTLLLISFFTTPALFAQVALNDGESASSCITLATPVLRYQSRDATTNGEVSIVQDFLIDKGLLTGSPTGFYGRMTVNAVKAYQAANGVSQTGNVGPLTRSVIQTETCGALTTCSLDMPYTVSATAPSSLRCSCPSGSTEINLTSSSLVGTYAFKCSPSVMCTQEIRFCPDGSTMQRDPNCYWRSDKCPSVVTYSLGLLPVTTTQALQTGVNYTAGWTGTGNPATPAYVVELVKGNTQTVVANLGTATAALKSFGFTLPATVSSGSDYRLRFGGALGEVTNAFTIQGGGTAQTLSFSTSTFAFSYTIGSSFPQTQALTFTNTSASSINYTITVPNQPSWLNTSYTTGTLVSYPGGQTGLGASVNPSGLSAGTYTTNIILTGNFTNSPMVIPVTLVVSSSGTSVGTPQVTLSSTATNIVLGQPVTLNYTVTNGSYCTASGNWSGTVSAPTTGALYWTGARGPVYPPAGASYTLTCYNGSGASDSKTLPITVTGQ